MRKTMGWAALALAMLASGAARADYEGREIGEWIVSAKEDRFGDGGTYLAMTAGDGLILAVRCIQKVLSVGIVTEESLRAKDLFEFKFKVDREPVVERAGFAINEHLIEIPIDGDLLKQMRDGKELAMRMQAATFSSTHIIRLRGSSRAFADIAKECLLKPNEAVTDDK